MHNLNYSLDSDSAQEADHDTQRFFDSVFSAVDSYCSDPALIDKEDLDEQGLLDEVINLQASWKR
ncbi:colicin immunity domain-containing protein [Enterobacteriaceae bacterium LUAb1]